MEAQDCICVVDDDEAVRDALGVLLEITGYRVRGYASAEAFLAENAPCDCLVTDVNLPGMGGLELVSRARARAPQLRVVVITARLEPTQFGEAFRRGAAAIVEKPFHPETILAAIRPAAGARPSAKNPIWAPPLAR